MDPAVFHATTLPIPASPAPWRTIAPARSGIVIPASVVELMAPGDLRNGFLTWFPFGVSNGDVLLSHGGGDAGVRTFLALSRRGKRGVIVLTNGEKEVGQLAGELYGRLVESRRSPRP